MINALLTTMQQPWYVFSAISMLAFLVGLLCDDKCVRDEWLASALAMLILAICWPITAGFLLGSLAQRWLK